MRALRFIIPLAILAATLALGAGTGLAKHGNDDPAGDDHGGDGDDSARVVKRGDCSRNSSWKLEVEPDDGRLETEFEVDQNRSGVRWKVRIRRDGKTVATGRRRTRPPSGSFEFERHIRNPAGTNRISAVAKRRSGEVCRGSVRI